MLLTFSRKNRTLVMDGLETHTFPAFSEVRNELTGERPDPSRLPDVEYSMPLGSGERLPVMPRTFPEGSWDIFEARQTDEKWLQPVKLMTNAHQKLNVWKLGSGGNYESQTDELVDDSGYRVHYCNGSHHTDGCIGLESLEDMKYLATVVQDALTNNERVQLVVNP